MNDSSTVPKWSQNLRNFHMELISKTLIIKLLKIIGFGIIVVVLISSFSLQNSYGHDPNFRISTTEDILKFCEFFYEEYQLLGVDNLSQQHPNFPNLRACVILYNHIAWNSTHPARDIVLISEIEKYLGDSSYIKERHLEYSNIIPNWIKKEARLWVDNVNQDTDFAYGVRTMIKAGVLLSEPTEKECEQDKLCFKEGDFIKYSHIDKYKDVLTIEHEVYSISDDEIILKVIETSKDGTVITQMNLGWDGLIKTEKCCKFYEYVIPMPIKLNDIIAKDLKIITETTYTIDNQTKQSWLASDFTGQNVKIIDKDTGLVYLYKFHETKVLSVGDETKITDTNFFDTKYNGKSYHTEIPKWWKTTTKWLLEEKISDSEYLRAMENLISRNILRV
ncbi:MAG: hypothetical protein ACE5RC_01100 [Nitrosopumilus sp.]